MIDVSKIKLEKIEEEIDSIKLYYSIDLTKDEIFYFLEDNNEIDSNTVDSISYVVTYLKDDNKFECFLNIDGKNVLYDNYIFNISIIGYIINLIPSEICTKIIKLWLK